MTNKRISTYYKSLSVVTLIVGIVGPMTLIEGTTNEKIWGGVLLNLQFHFAFQFLSRVPFGMYQTIGKENPETKRLAQMILGLFSWIMMGLSVIGFIRFLGAAINDYPKLLTTMTFSAIFLGGYSSGIKFIKN